MRILFEDNHLLVAVKPRNMPVQADSSQDDDMLSQLKEYIRHKYQKPGNVYLGLVHRLDRPVSGVVAFAKTSKAAARLSKQLQSHEMGREYLCVVEGEISPRANAVHYLLKDANTNTSCVASEKTPGAKRAELAYERLACQNGLSLVRVRLMTGRSHQIRVQMKALGHPLWGDNRYGNGKPGMPIALYARALSLKHPVTKQQMRFDAGPPTGAPFDQFPQLD